MPRDSVGVVTLPVGNPVVAGTAISADVHNATIADLASMIEDSLSRSGKGGMNSAMQFVQGTDAAPAITFVGDTNTGINSDTGGQIDLVADGTAALSAVVTGVTIPGTLAVTGAISTTGTAQATKVTETLRGDLQESASCGVFATSSLTNVDVTNLDVTITTLGRPVILAVVPNGGAFGGHIGVTGGAAGGNASFEISRGGTTVGIADVTAGINAYSWVPSMMLIDFQVAGTYTYKVSALVSVGTAIATATAMKLVAYEL